MNFDQVKAQLDLLRNLSGGNQAEEHIWKTKLSGRRRTLVPAAQVSQQIQLGFNLVKVQCCSNNSSNNSCSFCNTSSFTNSLNSITNSPSLNSNSIIAMD
jgi:hypothetical protein